jgi:hypothetical protein
VRRADVALLALLSLLALFACKTEETPPGDDDDEKLPTKDDPNERDGSIDGAVLVPSDSSSSDAVTNDACPGTQLACGAAGCVDTMTNPEHCGGCNKSCEGGTCSAATCQ